MKTAQLLCFLLAVAGSAIADDAEYPKDPYLQYRPDFARSLPVQIMLTGVVLTLVAVLFIHLMFTAQYHWPLAPVNYVLQLSGVTTLLISLIATIHVVLSATFAESEKWPYMLSYIAVNVPPLDLETNTEGWSIAERATWLVMNASTSGLIQITHIQFLTLLYPSRLEGRLIFTLLGPLAVVAAVMQLLPISGSAEVNSVASAVRNVCNATLSLLFTVALFIWGVLVNRKQAWRTDGGTAVFGCAALSLAVVSTALNFLYVHKEEEFVWLPGLMWAVVLWQSFLGWWWWVGAGSGGGFSTEDENMEEKLRREAKRERRKKEAREKRKETKIKAQRVWQGVADAFSPSSGPTAHSTSAQSTHSEARSRTRAPNGIAPDSVEGSPTADVDASEASEEHRQRRRSRRRTRAPSSPTTSDHEADPDADSASLASRATSMTLTSSYSGITRSTLPRMLPSVVHRWYSSLRSAHNAAARLQAAERVERMRELGRGRERDGVEARDEVRARDGWPWGWGDGLGWGTRRAERPGKSLSQSRSRSRSGMRAEEDEDGEAVEMDNIPERRRRRRRRRNEPLEDIYVSEEEEEYDDNNRRRPRRHRRPTRVDEEEEEDHEPTSTTQLSRSRSPSRSRNQSNATTNTPLPPPAAAATRPRSVWWWGPLRRWRLQDSTSY